MNKKVKFLKIVGTILLVSFLAVVALCLTVFLSAITVKFDKEKLIVANQEIAVFDGQNNEIQSDISRKNLINIEELSQHTINAFVSIEDKSFFEHKGLNYKRIVKAMINNLKAGGFKEGASTISQQLIKNTHLSSEKTIKRKLNEIFLTKKMEKEFSKKDILESYLNVIYFGENSYGIESAAQRYFGKSAKDLNLTESATLAGIIKSPYTYSPIHNADKCKNRRNIVLSEMLEDKKITKAQYEDSVNTELNIINVDAKGDNNSLYIKSCINEAQNILKMSEKELRISGIKIYSYLDIDKQNLMCDIVNNEDNYHKNTYGNINDSLSILVDNKTCGVVAFAGKSDYDLVDFERQPGSTIKPVLVYAPALEIGMISPKSLIFDEEVDYDGYSPKNVGGSYNGYVSIEQSVNESLNIPAVKILDYLGVDNAKDFARNLGINFDKKDNGLALALGGFTNGLNLKDLTNSYLPFVNNGRYSKCGFIKRIEDCNGKVIYEHHLENNQVMGEDTAYLMTDMLKNACKVGTSKKLNKFDFDVAGKTGTVAIKNTNNNTDAYSIAYTSGHTMGVWIGNYANDEEFILEGKNNGGTFATNMIRLCFEELYSKEKPNDFEMPNSVAIVDLDLMEYKNNHTIKLASANCPERYKFEALFSKRYMPKEVSDLFQKLTVKGFDVKLDNKTAKITFDAEDYLKYEICRIENGECKTLKSITNKADMVVYYDTNLKPGTRYGYYINIKTIDDKASATSETISILTDENKVSISNLVKKNNKNDFSWIFG